MPREPPTQKAGAVANGISKSVLGRNPAKSNGSGSGAGAGAGAGAGVPVASAAAGSSTPLCGAVPTHLDSALPISLSVDQTSNLLDATTEFLASVQRDMATLPAAYIEGIHNPAEHHHSRAVAKSVVEPDMPTHGESLSSLLETINRASMCGMNHSHPGFMGFVAGGSLPMGGLGPLIDSFYGRYTGVAMAAPGLVQLEENVIRWMTKMVGYLPASSGPDSPASAASKAPEPSGVLLSGGSFANFTAVIAAREKYAPKDLRKAVAYSSAQTHHCVSKGCRLAGIPGDHVREVPSLPSPSCAIDTAALSKMIAEDKAAGLTPFLVVGNAGTTNTGAVDDLTALSAIAKEHNIWFHVDAAYGGFFVLTERGREALKGIHLSDSVSMDCHKSLFMPHGTAALLVQDKAGLAAAHCSSADYMPHSDGDAPNFCEMSLELTRPYRGLGVWILLKLHGVDAFRSALDAKLDDARHLHALLQDVPFVRTFSVSPLSIVTFQYYDEASDSRPVDANNVLSRQLMEGINKRRRVFVSPTKVEGQFIVRACVLTWRTGRKEIEDLVEDATAAAKDIHALLATARETC